MPSLKFCNYDCVNHGLLLINSACITTVTVKFMNFAKYFLHTYCYIICSLKSQASSVVIYFVPISTIALITVSVICGMNFETS